MVDQYRPDWSWRAEEGRGLDPFHHARTFIDEDHRLSHDGMWFYAQRSELDVPDGAARQTLFRVGALPTHIRSVSINASEGPVVVELYENADVNTLGAQVGILPTNRVGPKTPLATLYDSTTIFNDIGSPLIGGLYVPANGNQGVSGRLQEIPELILLPNVDYTLEVENDPLGGGTADIIVVLGFYEISYDENPTPEP